MSNVAVKGNASGTGTFTIAAPNSNNNRQFDLPDENGTIATIENIPPGYDDQDALDLFNVTGSAPVYACRAWVNFDGTGTVSIRESGNVSSITDNGTGDYTVNFATAMPDKNFAATAIAGNQNATTGDQVTTATNRSTNSVRIYSNSAGQFDRPEVFAAIFR